MLFSENDLDDMTEFDVVRQYDIIEHRGHLMKLMVLFYWIEEWKM